MKSSAQIGLVSALDRDAFASRLCSNTIMNIIIRTIIIATDIIATTNPNTNIFNITATAS